MENVNDNVQLKARSGRACIADGYRFFMNHFRRILRDTWLVVLVFAVLNTLGVALPALINPQLLLPGMGISLLAIIVLLGIGNRRLLRRSVFEKVTGVTFATWMHHVGLLLMVLMVSLIVVLALSTLCALPGIIITMANWESQMGQLIGDASGMPPYVAWLSGGALWLVSFLQGCVWLSILPPLHLAKASVATQKKEKKELNNQKI